VWKEKNPTGYAFKNLKSRAKQRGHEFSLTQSEFRHFCDATDILDSRGKFKGCLSIDRRCPLRGYHAWNIRPLETVMNSRMKHSSMPAQMQEAYRLAQIEQPF
jgi:hypothetical protein